MAAHDSDDLVILGEAADGLRDRIVVDGMHDRVQIRRMLTPPVDHEVSVGLEVEGVAVTGRVVGIERAEQFLRGVQTRAERIDGNVLTAEGRVRERCRIHP